MKPRNKKQQHIVELSGRLRPLTTAQKQWAFSHTIDHYAYRLKSGKAVCMDRHGDHLQGDMPETSCRIPR